MKRILIIGGVAAGATAAARARRLDGEADITLLEAGDDVSFANCGLPYFIGGDVKNRSDLILASPETFHDQYRVNVHTATEVSAIDRAAKSVSAVNKKNGKKLTFKYDALILAQGGNPIVPPLPGVDRKNVFQLWTLDDMDKINSFIKENSPRTAVVVGGGFIGLEMVEALAKRGMQVQLVEMAPQIMPLLEAEMAGFLEKELLDYGVTLHLGKGLQAIEKNGVKISDGSILPADMVLLSVGVRPTLKLAQDAGLAIGTAGGLLVDDRLQTSDENIYAAGDMVEIENRVNGRKTRIPLAGPANRQGRIAGENAVGGNKRYKGASGTSVVKLFGAVAGSTGLNLKQARDAGFDADAVVVHKASHTSYYPGSSKVSLMLVFEKESGKILGAQAAGRVGVDKRIDVLATAIAGGLALSDLEELDLAYAPPFNSPNGPVHMAAFAGENHRSGFSPSVLAQNLESFVIENEPLVIDLRDPLSFRKAHLEGSNNLSQNILRENYDQLPKDHPILLISEDGQKGHVSLRMLKAAGFDRVFNLSGGYISLERHARALPFARLGAGLFPVEKKSVEDERSEAAGSEDGSGDAGEVSSEGPLILDVRTWEEFSMGAVPGATSLPLDDLPYKAEDLIGAKDREVIVYCASGARSAYARRVLAQMGFTNVENGGGLHDMMARL
ncbi:FAD-dependent oxidoreductase [Treponema zuelzerae]|uniref:FAD-dependent oxidoreductase n=1 Tax=Teretinema zuelzerae TaxID=156 RepID=A0AAE3JJ37_9SPIR|nr:FAD-dependent oxidoreductase [Teretinema zuelzerae]MCD1655048.1 FAD-dependent oxidoreductase [Teretinema zuelzerae]